MPRISLSTFENLNKRSLLKIVNNSANDKIRDSILLVASRIIDIPEFSCTINIKAGEDINDYMNKWTKKYIKGYENRPSKRISNPIGTIHDEIIDEIISARIDHTPEKLEIIKYGHRLSMSVENIAGAFLEEFISIKLLAYGWHCCWGETMKSIDFCNEDGQLLQIKNSDNSENSSSKAVRDGTEIKHWFRRFSKTGKTNWEALNLLVGLRKEDELNEISYKQFVKDAVTANPQSIFLEKESPFLK